MADNTSWMAQDWPQEPPPATDLRPEIPHPARIYDYFLGGKDNFPADRAAAEQIIAIAPGIPEAAKANRAFLQRAVRFVAEQGIDQFLDIGTGIPTEGNTHEVAQQVDPQVRVVYVDNDPIVLAHARALMAGPRTAGRWPCRPTCATRPRSSPTRRCARRWTSTGRSR